MRKRGMGLERPETFLENAYKKRKKEPGAQPFIQPMFQEKAKVYL